MYLAQLSTFQTQAPFYINTLENILSGNVTPESKSNIDSAIYEAAEVAKGNKDVFTIDNDHYFLITTLLAKFKSKLLQIDKKELQKDVYSGILTILK